MNLKPLTAGEARILQEIFTSRMRYYVTKWLSEDLSPGEVQSQIWRLASEYQFELKPESEPDPNLRDIGKRFLGI